MSRVDAVLSTEPAAIWLARDDVLGVIELNTSAPLVTDPRHLTLGLPGLSSPATREIWLSAGAVETGRQQGLNYARNADHLFCWLRDEPLPGESMRELSQRLYAGLLDFLVAQPARHPLRFWNMIGDINAGDGDQECYRQFCLGRFEAFEARHWNERDFPAATGIGAEGRSLFVAMLAGAHGGRHIENPRQVSAYHYPPDYGPRSPSFARATILPDESALLLISGTASVIGHASAHPGDAAAQFDEAWRNVQALCAQAGGNLAPHSLKIYLRDAGDYDIVAHRLQASLPQQTPVAYLLGDICRRELLLEIEAVFAPA